MNDELRTARVMIACFLAGAGLPSPKNDTARRLILFLAIAERGWKV